MATLITKNSSTAAAVPGAGDLVQGELAVNVADKRLFTKDAGGTVVEVGTNPSSLVVAGNVGVGVTPSAWQAYLSVYQASRDAAFGGVDGGAVYGFMSVNAYADGSASPSSATWRYQLTGSLTSKYEQTSGEHRWFTAPSGTAGDPINFTQAMTLDASGNLGVGKTATTNGEKFGVRGSGATSVPTNLSDLNGALALVDCSIGNTAYGAFGFQSAGGGGAAVVLGRGTAYDTNILFCTNPSGTTVSGAMTERARITSGGDLLVGQVGSGPVNINGVAIGPTNTGGIDYNHSSGTASGIMYARFNLNGATIGSITQDGTTAVLYNTTSDQRLKTNIIDAPDAAALIDGIQVRSFDWIADGSHQRYGMVAQELAAVAPEAVHTPLDPDEMMAVDYSKLVPMLIKEIQSLRARVAALETP